MVPRLKRLTEFRIAEWLLTGRDAARAFLVLSRSFLRAATLLVTSKPAPRFPSQQEGKKVLSWKREHVSKIPRNLQ